MAWSLDSLYAHFTQRFTDNDRARSQGTAVILAVLSMVVSIGLGILILVRK